MTRSALKGNLKNGCIRLGKTLRGKGGLRPCIELRLSVFARSGRRRRCEKGRWHSSIAAPPLSSYGPCQYWTDSAQHAATRGTRPMSMYAPGPAQDAPRGLPGDLDPGEPCGVESAAWLEGRVSEASLIHIHTSSGSVAGSSRRSNQGHIPGWLEAITI